MTLLALLFWLQSRPLSKTVIVVASLLFILAIVLVVYFVRKLRSSSKTEDDWSLTRSSLFVEPAQERPAAAAPPEIEAAPEPPVTTPGETRLLTSNALDVESRAAAPPA